MPISRVGVFLLVVTLADSWQKPPNHTSFGRRDAIGRFGAATIGLAGLGTPPTRAATTDFFLGPPERKGLQSKLLEQVRVLIQDADDAGKYGGELAPGGPPVGTPFLRLLPILQIRQTLVSQLQQLSTYDAARWDAVATTLATGQLETIQFKKILNAFSDNIYYASGSAEANAYLLGGSTPSTLQTTQYLLRNEILKEVANCCDEIAYQKGIAPEQREPDVAREALSKAIKLMDEYLALAPPDVLKKAQSALGVDLR